ncbi:FAD dependent oxidoreductase [bacterium A37T11]|nr:FAD dependent oxidoreductase [bacterium A37T11]
MLLPGALMAQARREYERPAMPTVNKSKSKHPEVLVYGSGPDAYAAAVQSAKSGCNTLWVWGSDRVGGELISKPGIQQINSNAHMDSGIWAAFLQKMLRSSKPTDSVFAVVKGRFNPRIAENVLEQVADSVVNLTYLKNVQIISMSSSGKSFDIVLSNQQKLKVRAVVDATSGSSLFEKTKGGTKLNGLIKIKTPYTDDNAHDLFKTGKFRTSVAGGAIAGKSFIIPMEALFPDSLNNYFATRNMQGIASLLSGTIDDAPLLMMCGQAIGASAAYCAFFKSSTDKIMPRELQGELITYGAALIPFYDILYEDPNYWSIQRTGVSGLLQGRFKQQDGYERCLFLPDSSVTFQELEPVFRKLYTRSQIWFADHQGLTNIKLKDLLGLIKYLGSRGNELDAETEKGWQKRFKFKGNYDPEHLLSRRQVAVLTDTYLQPQPFSVRIDRKGNFQN